MTETLTNTADMNFVNADDASKDAQLAAKRKKLFVLLGAGVAAIALGTAGWWYFVGRNYVSTDNAYVNVSNALVTPLTTGRVEDVRVHDSQHVNKGDILVVIDPEDAQLALNNAQAAYGATVRKVETYFAQVEARRADFERTRLDYERRVKIQGTGAMSNEEFTSVRAAYEASKAALDAAVALTHNTDVAHHPEVQAAKAQVDTAALNLSRTIVRSPIDGIVTQRQVQVGLMAAAGRPVMTIVPIQDVYVDANYKEDQLGKVHPGQPVELISDLYGSSVKYHGTVVGVGGGTGAAFAIIPAQNATGNWIKVVQRIPVRIALDPAELKEHPLRVGLSMNTTIDVSK